jgi:hypothetical protein
MVAEVRNMSVLNSVARQREREPSQQLLEDEAGKELRQHHRASYRRHSASLRGEIQPHETTAGLVFGGCMTPRATGDRGQRYEIRAATDKGTMVVGWTNDPEPMLRAASMAPWVRHAWIVDRQRPVPTSHDGDTGSEDFYDCGRDRQK